MYRVSITFACLMHRGNRGGFSSNPVLLNMVHSTVDPVQAHLLSPISRPPRPPFIRRSSVRSLSGTRVASFF